MLISRRAAIARGAALFAGLYYAGSAHAATRGVAYKLKAGPHCSCKACHRHAANKLFASRAAAQHHRAHPGCRCTVVRTTLDSTTWTALFGGRHKIADRRWASTKHALQRAARAAKAAKASKPAHATR